MKELTEQLVSPFSVEVTKDKAITVFRGLGFGVEKKEKEYYAHKGSTVGALIAGAFAPKFEIYYTISEVKGKTLINLRAPISFWKGGGLWGMSKQESKFNELVATISVNITKGVKEKPTIDAPVSGTMFCPKCGISVETQRFCPKCKMDLITGDTGKKTDLETKDILSLAANIIIPGVGTIIHGETKRGAIQLVLGIFGIITLIIIIGFFIMLGVWLWALIDGIFFVMKRELIFSSLK